MADGVVDTRYGRIRGIEQDGTWRFLGVRYAKPPVGELRLRSPMPPDSVRGVTGATSFGPVAPQPEPTIGSSVPGDPADWDEDCLFLNVWTPAPDGGARPVMVFLHGGGFVSGSGASQLYRGDELALGEDVVVVTVNYRLGLLGFMAHPGLAEERTGAFGNWGLLDQIAALRWVRDNIAALGGDPANVTVFGESAGAISACNLLSMPAAEGLFHRAIVESGPAVATTPQAGARVAELLAAELGLEAVGHAQLAALPIGEILRAQAKVGALFDNALGLAFQPVIDGVSIVRHPADAIADGLTSGIDVLIGTNRDEFKYFVLGIPGLADLDESGLDERVGIGLRAAGLSDRVELSDVVETYRSARSAAGSSVAPFELFVAMASDWVFRIPAARLADAHSLGGGRTYCYLFDWESPFAGGVLGSCHALELPFVFGTLTNPAISPFCGDDEDARELSAAMRHAWASFARTGEPDGDSDEAVPGRARLGRWLPYEPGARHTMILGSSPGIVASPFESERRFWEAHLGRYGAGGPVEGVDPGQATLDTAGPSPTPPERSAAGSASRGIAGE